MILALLAILLAGAPERRMAVTFDDLPAQPGSVVSNDPAALRETTAKLLASFRAHGVPVTAFVNEGKLEVQGDPPDGVAARTALLEMWLDAGHELGNHTYAHRSLNTTPLEEFQQDVLRGEKVTRRLMEARGRTLRYFRHPFLRTGANAEKKAAFEAFLATNGYEIAPVTVDNDEYMYAAVYADARRRNDVALAERVAADYLRYMEAQVAFDEDVTERLLGRPIPQVLLLHANALNADHFGALAAMLERRGYRFVTLADALKDEAYRQPDTYLGERGISWLHRWELGAGKPRTPAPDPPDWLADAYAGLTVR